MFSPSEKVTILRRIMLISSTVITLPQCTRVSKHRIVHLKYLQFLLVVYLSKAGKRKKRPSERGRQLALRAAGAPGGRAAGSISATRKQRKPWRAHSESQDCKLPFSGPHGSVCVWRTSAQKRNTVSPHLVSTARHKTDFTTGKLTCRNRP